MDTSPDDGPEDGATYGLLLDRVEESVKYFGMGARGPLDAFVLRATLGRWEDRSGAFCEGVPAFFWNAVISMCAHSGAWAGYNSMREHTEYVFESDGVIVHASNDVDPYSRDNLTLVRHWTPVRHGAWTARAVHAGWTPVTAARVRHCRPPRAAAAHASGAGDEGWWNMFDAHITLTTRKNARVAPEPAFVLTQRVDIVQSHTFFYSPQTHGTAALSITFSNTWSGMRMRDAEARQKSGAPGLRTITIACEDQTFLVSDAQNCVDCMLHKFAGWYAHFQAEFQRGAPRVDARLLGFTLLPCASTDRVAVVLARATAAVADDSDGDV